MTATTLLAALGAVGFMSWCGRQTGSGPVPSAEEMRAHVMWPALYVNPTDPRGWVPKLSGAGRTVNFRTARNAQLFASLVLITIASALGLVCTVLV